MFAGQAQQRSAVFLVGHAGLELVEPGVVSCPRKVALLTLRGYLVISVLLLIVKAVELGH